MSRFGCHEDSDGRSDEYKGVRVCGVESGKRNPNLTLYHNVCSLHVIPSLLSRALKLIKAKEFQLTDKIMIKELAYASDDSGDVASV